MRLFAIAPDGGGVIEQRQTSNQSLDAEPYLHVDVERIWAWLIEALADLGQSVEIEAIVPCAYGSTAALIDGDGLVLPMMDYEAEPPSDIADAYADIAPDFAEVCCPVNPGGLTLARQLFWQSRHFPKAFKRARWILPAAQYWAWRLTGKVATEVTALGAQTQLWNPEAKTVTELAKRERWASRFPPLRKAYDSLGPLDASLAKAAGLDRPPPVLVGIHDSNANYTRYLASRAQTLHPDLQRHLADHLRHRSPPRPPRSCARHGVQHRSRRPPGRLHPLHGRPRIFPKSRGQKVWQPNLTSLTSRTSSSGAPWRLPSLHQQRRAVPRHWETWAESKVLNRSHWTKKQP